MLGNRRVKNREGVAWIALLSSTLASLAPVGENRSQARAPSQVEIRRSASNTLPQVRIIQSGDRYELRNATLVDLIGIAWDAGPNDILGGPAWLDTDRFDLIASAPWGSHATTRKRMLQQLLRARFALKVRQDLRQRPVFALEAAGDLHAQRATGSGSIGCTLPAGQNPSTAPGVTRPPVTFVCQNVSMAQFVQTLSDLREASGYLLGYPVLDETGLEGIWDFQVAWTPRNALHADPLAMPGGTLLEALRNQVGVVLTYKSEPHPVIKVSSATRPHLAPPAGERLRFDAADIQPDNSADGRLPCGHLDIQPGGEIRIHMTLRSMILESQGDLNTHRIIDPANRLDTTCWQIHARASARPDAPAGWNGPEWNGVDIDSMRRMLRSLLEDHFGLTMHTGELEEPGYALVPSNPRIHPATRSNRSRCREGPAQSQSDARTAASAGGGAGADALAQDPRFSNPLASRLITCDNVTLAEFASELNRRMVGAAGPIVDGTGIPGRFDLTIHFSPGPWFEAGVPRTSALIPVAQALAMQLGLELRAQSVATAVLVVDHIEDQPTPR